ncbi:unnamed protein product [Mesocestoides corti]|uniref:TPH domain-containing protein n=1 Tax=Mesocestoides corti TaxID=53468 RepID=A0A0R3UMP5_MESCO|nr:unnamed protein product [Mesocestoides corti]
MTPAEEERIYREWQRGEVAKRQKALFRTRADTITDQRNRDLEARRRKLREVLCREYGETMRACEERLQAMEIARKEDFIKEAAHIKELIRAKNAEIAERQYKRQFKITCDEIRECKPKAHRLEVTKDQKAIDAFRRKKRDFEKECETIVENQVDGFPTKLVEADKLRIEAKKTANKTQQQFLLGQIADAEEKRKGSEQEKIEEIRKAEEAAKEAAELKQKEALKLAESKEKLRESLECQIAERRKSIQDREAREAAFDAAMAQLWQPLPKQTDHKAHMRKLNREAKYFLQHQQQVRDHRKCFDADVDRRRAEIAEKEHKELVARDMARRCHIVQINRDAFAAHKAGAEEKAKRLAELKALDDKETQQMLEEQRIQGEKRDALEAAKEAERRAAKASLMKQLEAIRERRKQAAAEVERERECYRLAEKSYLDKVKELTESGDCWNEAKLHPWRKPTKGISHVQ